MNWLKNIVNGFAFGLANVIPGVSGGTLALMLGFYERMLNLLHQVKPEKLKSLFVACFFGGREELSREWKKADLTFGVQLGVGALTAVVLLGPVMTYLLREQFSPTYGFFFGLILISVWVPMKWVTSWNGGAIAGLLVGLGLVVAVAVLVNPADKTMAKSALLQAQSLAEAGGIGSPKMSGYPLGEYFSVAVAGFVGISAMLLPGISGSLLLILMGKYEPVLSAIAGARKFVGADIIYLSVFCLGMLLGVIVMSRLITFAMKKFANTTMGFLTGLVMGSLYSLWPFKDFIVATIYKKESGEIRVYENYSIATNINLLPEINSDFWITLTTFAVGVVLMLWFLRNEPTSE